MTVEQTILIMRRRRRTNRMVGFSVVLFILVICGGGAYWAYNNIKSKDGIIVGASTDVLNGAINTKIQKVHKLLEKKSNYYQKPGTPLRKKVIYTYTKKPNEDFFKRHWKKDHWVYTPTHSTSEPNLFRRAKNAYGYWGFIALTPLDKHPSLKSERLEKKKRKTSIQDKHPSSEDEGLEKARKEIQDELKIIRDQRTQ